MSNTVKFEKASEVSGVVLVGLPASAAKALQDFMLDKKSGSVVLNIKDGQILKFVVEDHVRI